jgi:hypothetical protein
LDFNQRVIQLLI